ncbi:DNA repair protein RecO [Atribacter laminatus]|jgi:DNA repair protein RecO (recombination protein O)|uniref:DNA repair protein RecO n=1 Tax=Atribacter laminatus TaxID=2847778 RepID=A0A7T1AM00_ATRLM|nr:DNA repair protein RecO [Atribacter laminatus]QPM68382.1 DNA repair protein RecO [Atribacter laminatus]
MMKTGRYWKDQGIVLKSINYGELDRIVTLFTRKKGKISAIAKGARKVGNRFGPALDCPAISNFMFYDGRGMPVLSQADIVDCYRGIGKKTNQWVFANYLLYVIDRCYEPEESDERIFETVLFYLDLSMKCENFNIFTLKFRIDLIRYLGFFPRIRACAVCGNPFKKIPPGWSSASGGVICEKCSSSIPDLHYLPPDMMVLLGKLMTFSCASCLSIQLRENQFAYLDRLVSEYLTYHVEKKITEWKVFLERFQEVS